jgi:ADP-dependent NAD(P)H-hydrate dehydratase / NAD(P)H-hydrate epimerase
MHGLQRITPFNGPWPLHGAAVSRGIEQAALAGLPPGALMARAGLAVARLALALAPRARRIAVWAGPGNNGGDALIAATHLQQQGLAVTIRRPGDAAHDAPPPGAHDLVIDGLLGLGATRAPAGDMAAAIATLNAGAAPVLAIDLPSGLHPDTGQPLGGIAVRAAATLQLLTLKPGCFTAQGRDHAGAVWFDGLGVEGGQAPTAWLAGAAPRAPRHHATHKGSFGDVAVVGGAPGMAGAAWLAASAALAAGAGRVYASLFDASSPAPRPELMTRPAWWHEPPAVLAATTVACGCGGGTAVAQALPTLLAHAGRLVLDADALNAIATDPMLRAQLARRSRPTLLTPHPLEAARLLGCDTAAVQTDRLAAAQQLADACGATVLLKGSGTVVASPGQPLHINPTGNAALATPGSGDVLAGWIAGCWAQQPALDAHRVATLGAWQHGAAADTFAAAHPTAPLRAAALIEWLAALP